MIKIEDHLTFGLRGEIEVSVRNGEFEEVLFCSKNLICDSAMQILLGFFTRDLDNKIISRIAIGTGGDVNPATHLDTGARVAPQADETHVRVLLYDSPIVYWGGDTTSVTFTTVAKPETANSNTINEFGLLAEDGTMLAHFITEEDPLSGRAKRYVKTPLLYLVVRWKIIPTLVRP